MTNNVLTREDLVFLQGLAKELKAQDSRGTAKPLIYKIREEVVVTGLDADYGVGQCLISEDGKVYFFDEVCNLILSEHPDYDDVYKLAEDNGLELAEEDYEGMLSLFYELGMDGWQLSHFREEFKFSGEFLTYESAETHLKENRHHYNDTAVIYTAHAWRNPLLENLVTIIEKFDIEEVTEIDCENCGKTIKADETVMVSKETCENWCVNCVNNN